MTKHTGTPTPYMGVDNLEVMREAENYNRYLLDLIVHHAGRAASVVDFGAGSGTFAAPCRDLGLDVTAIEPDDSLRRLLAAANVPAVATTAALPDHAFQFAYSLNVLEHIDDDTAALRALRAKLVPGGRLLAYVPAFPVLFTSMDSKVGHHRRYTRETLGECIRAAGFEIELLRYADSLGFLATLLFKTFDGGRGEINRGMLKLYDRLAFPVSKALDAVTHRWFGKNVFCLARTPRT